MFYRICYYKPIIDEITQVIYVPAKCYEECILRAEAHRSRNEAFMVARVSRAAYERSLIR